MTTPHLFQPLRVAGLTLKNRLLAAPTSLAELGPGEHYSKENLDYYRLKAAGGWRKWQVNRRQLSWLI